MKEIFTNKGEKILVSDEDYNYLNRYTWYIFRYRNGKVKAIQRSIKKNGKTITIQLTKEIGDQMGLNIDRLIGHRDRNVLNNQRDNLVEMSTNDRANHALHPKRHKKASKYRGVYPCRRKWKALICYRYKRHYIGSFASEEEAAHAYDKAARELHGEFAVLNFPS